MMPTPPPGGPRPPGPGPQQPPRSGGDRRFFESIRWSGWFRAEPRIIGGVCSGIAARWGWDPLLVRGITAIAMFFAPFLLAVYGAAWLLLPEQRDGRIHLDELVSGRFDIAVLGGFAAILLGMGGEFPVSFVLGSRRGVIWGLLCALIGIVVFIVLIGSAKPTPGGRPPAGTPHPPAHPGGPTPGGPGAHDPASAPSSFPPPQNSPWQAPRAPFSAPQGAPSPTWQAGAHGGPAPYAAPRSTPPWPPNPAPTVAPVWTPPPVPRPRTVGLRANLIVSGLVFLTMAATFYAMYDWVLAQNDGYATRIGLIGAGACLLIVGIALAVASLRDRAAAWIVSMTIIGMLLAAPVALIGAAWQEEEYETPSALLLPTPRVFTWEDSVIDGINASGSAVLDLSQAPVGTSSTIRVTSEVWSLLDITARSDQQVRILCEGELMSAKGSYLDPARTPDWLSGLKDCALSADDDRGTITAQTRGWQAGRGFTIVIDSDALIDELAFTETSPLDRFETPSDPQGQSDASPSATPPATAPQSDAQSSAIAPSPAGQQ
ncbi:PspC domain-containing protein [Actinomyces sp. B33]|uniref:PspC domain-containing protein n=1 Tax=Actinomyces sp. B33 TaxID=2942131 RepID=UPI002341AE78|nr:PspC domain-containing protein [Actinomyces sp. B33]MDC4233717.1 PspC domain-containing protein [Actinomyces sp. B33]